MAGAAAEVIPVLLCSLRELDRRRGALFNVHRVSGIPAGGSSGPTASHGSFRQKGVRRCWANYPIAAANAVSRLSACYQIRLSDNSDLLGNVERRKRRSQVTRKRPVRATQERMKSNSSLPVASGAATVLNPVKLKLGSGLLSVVRDECSRCDVALTGELVASDMVMMFSHIQMAVKTIASCVARASLEDLMGAYEGDVTESGGERDKQKKLDVVANNIMKNILSESGMVAVLASEEDDGPVLVSGDGGYVAVFDPLDGSRNIEASIPTGTIFGIYKTLPAAVAKGPVNGGGDTKAADVAAADWCLANVLQPGSQLIAAGYALFSSATMLVLTLGTGTHGFTLDPTLGEFLLTHPNIQIPKRGQIYSVNDGRYFDWPEGLRKYIDAIRQGKGQNPKKYSARYICSLVADLHRTLLYGGIAMNPRSHLRLVYEANPMSFIVEQAGGKGSDGKRRILDIQPSKVHERLPLFLGSFDDVSELESYGDIQQVVNPGYQV